ncbi:MAG: Bug family tripartite tricarboxylate transporter substrate binding protein [Lautropia sp.]
MKSIRFAALLMMLAYAALGFAQPGSDFPAKSVRIIVGNAPGGTGDLSTRIVARHLSERLGQQFVIENRPGAGGVVAAKSLAAAPADGHTLLMVASGIAVSAALFNNLGYDPVKDFAMISQMSDFAYVFAVSSESKFNSLSELVADARARPGKLNLATISVGSGQYLTAELFKSMAKIEAVTVPFKGSPDVTAAIKGRHADVAIETVAPLVGMLGSGELRGLAVSSAERFAGLPNIPTVKEQGFPDYAVSVWNGIAAPAGTPRGVIDKLNREINLILALPDVQKQFLTLGITARGSTPEALTETMASEIRRWREVVTAANIPRQ